jgi:hypothetical protein
VAAGARLEGNAISIWLTTLNGLLAPGGSELAAMQTGNISFKNGSSLELQLVSSTELDQLRVAGTVSLSGAVELQLFLGDSFVLSNPIPILLNDGSDAIVRSAGGGFAIGGNILDEGESFTVGGQAFRISYSAGDGNDIYLTVPEPSSGLLVLAAVAALSSRRSSRSRD